MNVHLENSLVRHSLGSNDLDIEAMDFKTAAACCQEFHKQCINNRRYIVFFVLNLKLDCHGRRGQFWASGPRRLGSDVTSH
eukprot:645974-Hanusia_phi.AAC.1